jgi:hypothetical protein
MGGVDRSLGALTFEREYLHADFGGKLYINPSVTTVAGTVVTRDVRLTDDMVRVGMNLKFDWGCDLWSQGIDSPAFAAVHDRSGPLSGWARCVTRRLAPNRGDRRRD